MSKFDQKNQFLARIATCTNPLRWPAVEKFQLLLGLPAREFDGEIAKLLNGWELPIPEGVSPVVFFESLLQPELPKGSRRIFTGVKAPVSLKLGKIMDCVWFHKDQVEVTDRPRPLGDNILRELVLGFPRFYQRGVIKVAANDPINGHFGLRELKWLEQNWETAPPLFRQWAKGRRLYGWADLVVMENSGERVPNLNCELERPHVEWGQLGHSWDEKEPAMRIVS